MENMSFDSSLYEEEGEAYSEFLEKGAKKLDDIELITVHALLARCEQTLDKERKFIAIVEDEIFARMNARIRVRKRWLR